MPRRAPPSSCGGGWGTFQSTQHEVKPKVRTVMRWEGRSWGARSVHSRLPVLRGAPSVENRHLALSVYGSARGVI